MDKSIDYMLSLPKSHRDALAKQLIFDCVMELFYQTEGIPNDVLANKLMDALQALDTE